MLRQTRSRRGAWLRALRWTLVFGALYDLVFAVIMLSAPELPGRLLALPVPPFFFLWLIAILLSMLAVLYLLAALDPVRYRGNVLVAIIGRAAGGLALGAAAMKHPELVGLYPLAVADLLFALSHAICGWPLRHWGVS